MEKKTKPIDEKKDEAFAPRTYLVAVADGPPERVEVNNE